MVDVETREYFESLRSDMASMRGDIGSMQTEIGSMRTDIGSMRTEIGSMRTDIGSMRTEIVSLRTDMSVGFAMVDQRFEALDTKIDRAAADFEVTVEDFRHQAQVLAEGVVMNAEALNRFRTEFLAEIHEIRRGR